MSWGPFTPGIATDERKARLRSLRTCLKLQLGERGREAGLAVLRAEISGGDPDLLREASGTFDRLGSLDRRHVMSAFSAVNFPEKA